MLKKLIFSCYPIIFMRNKRFGSKWWETLAHANGHLHRRPIVEKKADQDNVENNASKLFFFTKYIRKLE
jgi:hypothetical protein